MTQENAQDNFETSAEGWSIITYPGIPNSRDLIWSKGKISYSPTPGEENYFFQAPARYLGDRSAALGGILSFQLGFDPAAQAYKDEPIILLLRDGIALAYFLSSPVSDQLQITVNTSLDENGEWRVQSDGSSASRSAIQNALKNLEGLLIRADLLTIPSTTVSLMNPSMLNNTASQLTPKVTVYYQGGTLFAAWDASPLAGSYEVHIADETGQKVYTIYIAAQDFSSPIILNGESFMPELGKAYQVSVLIRGPESEPANITLIEVGQVVLNVTVTGDGGILTWNTLAEATNYDVIITGVDNHIVYQRENVGVPPLTITKSEGLENDIPYQAQIRGRAELSFGEWSEEVTFTLLSTRQILIDLQQRLEENESADSTIIFNNVTLPEGTGNPKGILTLLQTELGVQDLSIVYSEPIILANDGLSLTVSGSTTWGNTASTVDAKFGVSSELELTLSLRFNLPATWKFSDNFPSLEYARANYLYMTGKTLVLSSSDYNDSAYFIPLKQGLNFFGNLQYIPKLADVTSAPSDEVKTTSIGGQITSDTKGVSLNLSGNDTVADLTPILTGVPSLTFTSGQASIKYSPENSKTGDTEIDKSVFIGQITLFNQPVACELDIPTSLQAPLTIKLGNGEAPSLSKFSDALPAMAGTTLNGLLPSNLLNLTGASVTDLQYKFDPAGQGETETNLFLSILAGNTLELVPAFITLGNIVFTLTTIQIPDEDGSEPASIFNANISGTFNFGGLPVDVSLFIPAQGDWTLFLQPSNSGTASLNNISGFTGESTNDILSKLPNPDFFQKLTGFSLTEIQITASIIAPESIDSFSPSLRSIGFRLEQNIDWKIVPNLLSLSGWKILTTLSYANGNWEPSGVLAGNLVLGSGTNPTTFASELTFPVGPDGWRIGLTEDGFDLPGLGDILRLIGADDIANFLPSGLQALGSAHISTFEVFFDPTASPVIKRVGFQMNTTEKWTLISDSKLEINNLEIGMIWFNGSNDTDKYALGYIAGTLTIYEEILSVRASRMRKEDPWIFEMMTLTVVHLPALAELEQWMLPDTVTGYLPLQLMPFSNGIDLLQAGLQFDLTKNNLNEVQFSFANRERWTMIEGFVFVDNAFLAAKIDQPLSEEKGLTLHAEVLLSLAALELLLKADKAAPNADWIFTGTLVKPVEFKAADVFPALSFKDISLDEFFPTSLMLESLNSTVNITQGTFSLSATSSFNWSISFAFTQLDILSLAIDIEIGPKPKEKDAVREYAFTAKGACTLAGVLLNLSYVTGNKTGQDTIFAALITPDQIDKLSVSNVVDTLTTTNTKGDKWASIKPDEYAAPTFANAFIYINRSKNMLYLYGAAGGYADAALLVKKIGDDQWGYALGVRLKDKSNDPNAPSFTFASILDSLSVIDSFLKVKNAGLFVISYEDSTTTLVTDLNAISAFPGKPEGFSSAVSIPNMDSISLTKGMFFYADLDINTSSLFNKLLEIGTDGSANLMVYGLIDKSNPVNTIFVANLPDITILSSLTFTHTDDYSGIHLQYSPNKNSEFILIARLEVRSVFGKDYKFDGQLTVDETHLDATLSLVTDSPNDQIENPFGIPGLVIRSLYTEVNYVFGNEGPPKTTTTSTFVVGGEVKIGPAPSGGTDNRPDIAMKLALEQGNPVLAKVSLTQDLSVLDFFNQFFEDKSASWAPSLFNITFKAGSCLYYYKKDADPKGIYLTDESITHNDGFNLETDIVLRILLDIPIHFTLQVVENEAKDQYLGVRAAGSFLSDPIDLYVLQIAGQALNGDKYSGAPEFVLDTTTTPSQMGLTAGFNFFQKPFGTTGLTLKKKDRTEELELSGHLASAQSFDPFGQLSLDFTYSSSDGFNITGWEAFEFAKEAIDFVTTLKNIASAGAGPCGKLASFVIRNAYTTKFTITPSFTTESEGLYFVLNGKYALSVLGNEFLSADFPNAVKFLLPSDLSLDALPGEIFNSLAGAAKSFVQAMLDNPEAIAKFLAIVGAENAGDYAADLVCEGLAKGGVTAAAEAGAAEISGGLVAGPAGAALIAAAGTAIATTITKSNSGGEPPGNTNPAPPSDVTIAYQNGQIIASWSSVTYASGYRVNFVDSAGTSYPQQDLPYTRRTASVTIASSASEYTVKVASTRDDYVSEETSVRIRRVPTPRNVQLRVDNDGRSLRANWFEDGQVGFRIRLLSNNKEVKAITVIEPPGELETEDLLPGTYTVEVTAFGDSSFMPSLPSTSNAVSILSAPQSVDVVFDPVSEKINVSWVTNSASPFGFQIQLLDGSGNKGISPVTAEMNTNQISIELSKFSGSPGEYHAEVILIGNDITLQSPACLSDTSITLLPPLTGLTQTADKTNSSILVSWTRLNAASQYRVELFEAGSEEPLLTQDVDQPSSMSQEITQTFDVKPYFNLQGASFNIKVRSNGLANLLIGEFASAAAPIIQIPAPTGITGDWDATTRALTMTWQGNEQALQYQIEVFDAPDASVLTRTLTAPATQLIVQSSDFSSTLNGSYTPTICALAGQNQFDSSMAKGEAVSIISLLPPVGVSLSLQNNMLLVNWQAINGVSAYDVELWEEGQPTPIAPQPPIIINENSATISLQELKANTAYKARVRVQGDANPWSDFSAPITTPPPVVTNNSLLLDPNTGDVAVIPLDTPITLNDFTVEVWVKTSETGDGTSVYNCDNAFSLAVVDGAIAFIVSPGDGYWKAYAQPADGIWHHIAAVRQNGTVQIYLDGYPVPVPTANAGQMVTCTQQITVGGLQRDNPSNRFSGMLDELRIWNIARPQEDIQSTMHITLHPSRSRQPNLLLYYNFDDGTGRELTGLGAMLILSGNARIVPSDIPVKVISGESRIQRITLVSAQASSQLEQDYNGKPQTAERLLENEDYTFWNSDDTGKDPTPWFWVELNEASIVQELRIRWKATFGEIGARAMKYRVFYSLDANTWIDTGRSHADVSNLSTQLDEDKLPGWSASTKFIKVEMSESSYRDGYFTCRGVEVWGTPDNA